MSTPESGPPTPPPSGAWVPLLLAAPIAGAALLGVGVLLFMIMEKFAGKQ